MAHSGLLESDSNIFVFIFIATRDEHLEPAMSTATMSPTTATSVWKRERHLQTQSKWI